MNTFEALKIRKANAICYSGFRDGQNPGGIHPSIDQIKEDLLILEGHWKYLRLYDCDLHSQRVLEVIRENNMDFKVMLGAYIVAEMNNFECPWGGGVYSEEQLEKNRKYNDQRIETLCEWANSYEDIVFSVSIGNEACVNWTDHYVSADRIIEMAKKTKSKIKQLVTYCENYVPWIHKLKPLAEVLDFVSIHTYPVWEYKNIHESIAYTQQNYRAVLEVYPDKPVVITEAGWATNSNGRGINPEHVNEDNQKTYISALMNWIEAEGILTFIFEAFDENWKGSPELLEPEKHWGLFKADRTPKKVVGEIFA